jgi:Tol biopolymer transport system component
MRRRSTLAAIGLMLVGASILAPLGSATSRGRSGRIAYMLKDGADHWQIWVANSRLLGAKKLTSGAADSGWAVWSPDGKRLAFDSNRTDQDPNDSHVINDVFVMRADGTGVTMLTDSKGLSGEPAWSPDGASIAIEADRGDPAHEEGIYVMDANGGNLRRVTAPAAGFGDGKPRFSPNGKQLAFTRYRGKDEAEKAAVFTVSLDGTHLRQLTTFAIHADDLDWSPDGRHIVFDGYPNPNAYGDIYSVDVSGRSLRNLTRNPAGKAGSADPVWAPNAETILFLDNRVINGRGRTGLATMRPDGSARRFVSLRNAELHQPDWESVH